MFDKKIGRNEIHEWISFLLIIRILWNFVCLEKCLEKKIDVFISTLYVAKSYERLLDACVMHGISIALGWHYRSKEYIRDYVVPTYCIGYNIYILWS